MLSDSAGVTLCQTYVKVWNESARDVQSIPFRAPLHQVNDGVAFIDADFAVHEDGQVDHEELPEAVRLDNSVASRRYWTQAL